MSNERITLRLTGAEAEHGLPLANLAGFVQDLRRALRDFDRQRVGAKTARGGHPTTREELVTRFRLVEFRPGSAIMELEPFVPSGSELSDAEQLSMAEAEQIAVENLAEFIDWIQGDAILDPAVTDAIESARKQLGPDGRIEISVGSKRRQSKHAVIDSDVVAGLEHRVRRAKTRPMQISGRLHMLDDEPRKVGIRAADGVDWISTYPPELEDRVASLMRCRVIARGIGAQQSSNRGRLNIAEIEPLEEYESTPLFTFGRVPLEELRERQGIEKPQGLHALIGAEELSDEELDAFLDAIAEG